MSLWQVALVAAALDFQRWSTSKVFCVLACLVVVSNIDIIGIGYKSYKWRLGGVEEKPPYDPISWALQYFLY